MTVRVKFIGKARVRVTARVRVGISLIVRVRGLALG